MKTIRDTWLMYRRSLILTLRQPVWVAMGLFQPILYLLLFAPLLEGATSARRRLQQRVQLVHPGPAHPDGILRRGLRGLRPGRRDPVRRRRADAGDPDEPLRDAGRSVAPGRDDPARPVDAADPRRHPVRPGDRSPWSAPDAGHRRAGRADVLPALVHPRARHQERGSAGAHRAGRLPTPAPAVRDHAADGARAGLASVPLDAQPADPRGRCGARAVQRPVGRPADRRRLGGHGSAGDPARCCSPRARSLGPTPDPSARSHLEHTRRPARRAGRLSVFPAPTIAPCPTGRSRCSSPSPGSTATTVARRCWPGACATKVSRSSTRGCARRPRWSRRRRSRRTSTSSACRSCRART